MKTKKIKTLLLVLLGICLVCAASSLALSFVLKQYTSLLIIASLVSSVLSLVLFVFLVLVNHKLKKTTKENKDEIIKSIEHIKLNQVAPAKIKDDQDDQEIASSITSLAVSGKMLQRHYVYPKNGFLQMVRDTLNFNEISDLAYLKISKPSNDIHKELALEFAYSYFAKDSDELDVVITNFPSRLYLEQRLNELFKDKDEVITLVYYPDYLVNDFDDIRLMKMSRKSGSLRIYEKGQYNFENYTNLVKEYMSHNNPDGKALSEFIRDSLKYLPFSHIALRSNNIYYRMAMKAGEKVFNTIDKDEFKYYEFVPLYTSDEMKITLVLASIYEIKGLSYQEQCIVSTFISVVTSLAIPEAFTISQKQMREQMEDTLDLFHSYYYMIDDNYRIVDVSNSLQEKYSYSLKGKTCYKAICHQDEACKNCPLSNEDVKKKIATINSSTYVIKAITKDNNHKVYIIDHHHRILSRENLEEKILDLINRDQKGYLLVFKINFVDDIALKYKVEPAFIIERTKEILKSYLIDGNLYEKADDEFVYILENFSNAEALEIATKLSNAFEDKIEINEKGVSLTPKTILLSYPLEVNSIFALDSLSRTLFSVADKKGRLYRLASDSLSINKKRDYLELIDKSLKDNLIPLSYVDVFDKETHKTLKEVHFDYRDENGQLIKEDLITLFAKLENLYPALLERTIRSIEFLPDVEYIFYLAREAFDNVMFATINNELVKRKVDPSQLILETSESYLLANMEIYNKYSLLGYQFAYSAIDNNVVNANKVNVKYVKIDMNKFAKDKQYAYRVVSLKDDGVDLFVDANSTLLDGRYYK